MIENTQRDLNIALVNELAMIFNKMDIETEAVLKAAGTKWNFLPFRPGLVGGHCIGVDPYYLTHKAEAVGCHPEVILAGRRINDGMGEYVSNRMVKEMLRRKIPLDSARIIVLGLTFKENCPDLRNTRVIDVVECLRDFGIVVDVHDPLADPTEAEEEYNIKLAPELRFGLYDGILLAVAHDEYRAIPSTELRSLGKETHLFFDLKSILQYENNDVRL